MESILAEALDQEALRASHRQLQNLLLLALVHSQIERPDGVGGVGAWDSLLSSIQSLNSGDLVTFSDRNDFLQPRVIALLNSERVDGGGGGASAARESGRMVSQLSESLIRGIHQQVEFYAHQTVTSAVRATRAVAIREVPPHLGIFRGCTGGDCSSQYSFPYPNDPNERVFFIESVGPGAAELGAKKLKGYVSATTVQLEDGRKALYVITISGSHVSAADTEIILRGLKKNQEALEVGEILLPVAHGLAGLINFPEIRGVFESHSSGKKPIRFHYLNPEIRSQIETFQSQYNTGTYDSMAANGQGVIFSGASSAADRGAVEVIAESDESVEDSSLRGARSELDREQLLEFLLDLSHSRRFALRDRVLAIPSVDAIINIEQFNQFFQILSGCAKAPGVERLSIEEFQSELEIGLVKMGVKTDLLSRKEIWLYPGILSCADAFSGGHLELVSRWVAADFKTSSSQERKIRKTIYYANRAALQTTSAFQKLIQDLMDKIQGSNAGVKFEAMKTLADLNPAHDPRVILTFLNVLKDESEAIREAALSKLISIFTGHPAQVQQVVDALRDSGDWHLRRVTAWFLGRVRPCSHEVILALAQALNDENEIVRSLSAFALREIYRFGSAPFRVRKLDRFGAGLCCLSLVGGWESEGSVEDPAILEAERLAIDSRVADRELVERALIRLIREDPSADQKIGALDVLLKIQPIDQKSYQDLMEIDASLPESPLKTKVNQLLEQYRYHEQLRLAPQGADDDLYAATEARAFLA